MIINFNVKNFRSIRDRLLLNLTATPELGSRGTIPFAGYEMNVLPLTGIYGANGSGKSNLIKAIQFMKLKVLGKASDPVTFACIDCQNTPSDFSMLFTVDSGVMYHYGFSLVGDVVLEEWLSVYDSDVETVLFSRVKTDASDGYEYEFSDDFISTTNADSKFLDIISSTVACARLWLSYMAESGLNTICSDVYSWFKDKLLVMDFDRDTISIEDMKVIIEKDEEIVKGLGFDFIYEDGYILDDIFNETSGFRRLCNLISLLRRDMALKNVSVVIDNFGNSIHRLVNKQFIEVFNSNSLYRLNSQLIFATHDMNIMDMRIIRRDEIQFVEKDRASESSSITNCAEYDLDPESSISTAYMEGRFGAVPLIRFRK